MAIPAIIKDKRKAEISFYNSVNNFCGLYHVTLSEQHRFPFPLNIHHSFNDLEEQFGQLKTGLELIILQDDEGDISVATVRSYDLDNTLFLIPVEPLAGLLRNKRAKKKGELLLSLFSYLYHWLKIPYYREQGSYIGSCYETMETWVNDIDHDYKDSEEHRQVISTYHAARYFGEWTFKRIRHSYNLDCFEQRLSSFKPIAKTDQWLYDVCSKAIALRKAHPERSLFQNITPGLLYPEEENPIYPDQYLSFFYSGDDMLYEQLIDFINCDFQETGVMDTPLAIQDFKVPRKEACHDLIFETEVFNLLSDLIDLLYKLPHEEYYAFTR